MKQSINWHKECLKNSIIYTNNLKKQLEFLNSQIDSLDKQNNFYLKQIEEALENGMNGFDAQKFLIKRSKK